jgi:Fe-S-cluster-containing hydrogenase component 2
MDKVYCYKSCPSRFCMSACPSGALKIEDSKIVVRSNRCYGCGLCRQMCMTWSVLWGQKK